MDPILARKLGLVPGTRVVEVRAGMTGEIHKVHHWGVQVFNMDRQYAMEDWHWSMITMRTPRTMIRYPRSLRFPRRTPSQQCHCRRGKLEVEGVGKVRCHKCGFLIGSESFPHRFTKAVKLLRGRYGSSSKRKRSKRKASLNPEISGQSNNPDTRVLEETRSRFRRMALQARRILGKKGGKHG
jgi:hypothetical protein